MKALAFYLPQYHEIPENNRFWGKGFTEWTNVKTAQPLFWGHNQPRVPLGHHYYNLLEQGVMSAQMKLAKAYGIYGFCIYHYWFCGKKLLEKPVENILNLPDKNFHYCFSWANGSWSKKWLGDQEGKTIIMRQNYGGEDDWRAHFEYLLPYFRDPRYIKKDGKPLFLIYRSMDIPRCAAMMDFMNGQARQNGLKGIFFIDTRHYVGQRDIMGFDASFEFEPFYSMDCYHDRYPVTAGEIIKSWRHAPLCCRLPIYDYRRFYRNMTERTKHYAAADKPRYLGAFVDWDNTARRKKDPTLVFAGASPKGFGAYFERQVKNSRKLGNEFIFINAWNEWGEGTYLEPDEKNGYGYLKAVKKAIGEETGTC